VQYLSRPNLFKQIHLHTDVRLTLGWAGVVVAAATGLYGWKVDFEQSKPVVWAGFIMHVSRHRTRILVSDMLFSLAMSF
jgi:signal peptidase complex subunit 2